MQFSTILLILIAFLAATFGLMLFCEWRGPATGGMAAVFISFVAIVAFAYFLGEQAKDQRRELVSVVVSYLDALQSGEFGAAYSKLCPQAQERVTLQEFVARQNAGPRLLDYEIEGATRRGSQPMQLPGPPIPPPPPPYGAVVEANLRFTDGTHREERYGYSYESPAVCVAG